MTEPQRPSDEPAPSDSDEIEQTRPLGPPAQPVADTLPTLPPAQHASTPAAHSATCPNLGSSLNPDNASQAWDIVSERVEALVEAWDKGPEPPSLADFLPEGPTGLRRLALVELIKVDLMYRWQRKGGPQRRLEQYLSEFPELSASGDVPYDLIYEEYYVRRQLGESVEPREYFSRFPRQAEELKRLLRIESDAHLTTALVSGERFKSIEVGDRLDDFDLLTRVGKGAFATVFLARQRSMQRLVALKISANRGNEPQTMAQLDHPHIVRVYDQRVLLERKLRLLYMQYIPGGTLLNVTEMVRKTPPAARAGPILMAAIDQSLVERGESPPPDTRLRQRLAAASWPEVVCWLGARLAAALDYAHQRGVLHRDLKPANVLIAADGSPKLADFNISFSSAVEGSSPAAYFGGSLAYMSPEQLEAFNPAHARAASEMDGRSDIYALGIVLWELLTGRRPFQDAPVDGEWSKTLDTMVSRRRAGVTPSTLAELPRDCPPGLDQILLGCLAPEPSARFATAGQLARQLELCLQPRVQRLLRPRAGDWRRRACRYSLLAMLVAGLLPNVIASGLNIAYNYFKLVAPLGSSAATDISPAQVEPIGSSAATDIFYVQLWVVNPIAYFFGVALLLRLAWPVLRAVRGLAIGNWNDAEQMPLVRRRCLKLGDYVAWVTAAEWTVSGIVFPLWIHLEGGEALNVQGIYYVHFLTSQVLCGLIAASQSFFCITFVCTRVFYPSLVQKDGDDETGLERLRRLAQRANGWFFLAVSVPFLAIFAVILLVNEQDDRIAVAILGAVGLLAFAIAYLLSQAIHRDADSLALAASPTHDALAASETVDSFWVSSR